MEWKIAFIGFGTVGQGFAEILLEKKELLRERFDIKYRVVAISDMLKGSIYDKNGLDLKKILDMVKAGRKLDEYPGG
ncbi:MAG TPA: homoserine dehydrogenase, partial [Thermoplasmatales archaeon]|nr:homoserine dehydrogenase [Thermoplasmatales archaeon]